MPNLRLRGLWSLLLAATVAFLSVSTAWPQRGVAAVGLLRNPRLADGDPSAAAVARGLESHGVNYRPVDESLLTDSLLRPFDLVVITTPLLSAPSVDALKRYAERGGRWVSYLTESSPPGEPWDQLVGVKPLTTSRPFSPNLVAPEPRSGMPSRLRVSRDLRVRACAAAVPSQIAARWDAETDVVALVRGPYGYFANFTPLADDDHAAGLVAMLGDVYPPLWVEAARGCRLQAVQAIQRAGRQLVDTRYSVGVTREERHRDELDLAGLRSRLPGTITPSADLESNRPLLAARVKDLLEVRAAAERLYFRFTPSRRGEVRGAWLEPTSRTDWEARMRRLRESGFNSVFVTVCRGTESLYPSQVLQSAAWTRGQPDEVEQAVAAAHRHGLAIHARRRSFELPGGLSGPARMAIPDERLVHNSHGVPLPWLNPGDPRNSELEFQAVLELVQKYDFDGLQFDQIHFPETLASDVETGAVSRQEFERVSGRPATSWPSDVTIGERSWEYAEWQRETLTRLLQRCVTAIRKVKPGLALSAAIAPDLRMGRSRLREDWPAWLRTLGLDFLVSRPEAREADQLAAQLDLQLAVVRGRLPLVIGVSAPAPSELVQSVDLARQYGADGFLVAAESEANLDAGLAALRAGAASEATWPAYLAPRATWTFASAVDRRELFPAFAVGDRPEFQLDLSPGSVGKVTARALRGDLRLEDRAGRVLSQLRSITGSGAHRARIEVPAGLFRVVLRGSHAFSDGSVQPFIIRGPLIEGVGSEALDEIRAQELPPVFRGNGRKVLVYAGSVAGPVLAGWLRSVGRNVALLHQLRPEHLAAGEVLILGRPSDPLDLNPIAAQALRAWVQGGGQLVLCGEAVGIEEYPRLFPTIGAGSARIPLQAASLASDLGTQKAGERVAWTGLDLIGLRPGPQGKLLLKAGESPVAVTGAMGRGRVTLLGHSPGAGGSLLTWTDSERALVLNLLAGEMR